MNLAYLPLVGIFSFCGAFTVWADSETPFPLGTSDLAPDLHSQVDEYKSQPPARDQAQIVWLNDFKAAFAAEVTEQLDLNSELEPSLKAELEALKEENSLLQIRVSALEQRLAAIETTLQD